jgi:hypothetical protein
MSKLAVTLRTPKTSLLEVQKSQMDLHTANLSGNADELPSAFIVLSM